ncbi:CLUMA_CG018447, isoform A [Clunio marinus]|uniref:CLUMA_CG018447, isoform A n=1 Tax=Clunio marinus TaxID=568069 RepID=A0A1J1IY08_9DIPT|nr:CLUMA_CG018447, isoform A [Clunio marinus]
MMLHSHSKCKQQKSNIKSRLREVEVMMRAPGEVALHSKQLIDDNDNSKCDAAANDRILFRDET